MSAKKDLNTFSIEEINTMCSYYRIPLTLSKKQKINSLIYFIYGKKANLAPGAIWDAINNNNLELFYEIVKLPNFNINLQAPYGESILCWTIINDNNEMAKYLIDNGANLDLQNNNGYTALLFAVFNRINNDISKYLIDHGANLNLQTRRGQTALIQTISGRNYEIAKYLIDHNPNLDLQDEDGNTALMKAILKKNNEIAKYLIDNGANLNLQNKRGETVFHLIGNNSELLNYIIDKDIKVPDEMIEQMPNYIKLKVVRLKKQIRVLKKLLNSNELELIKANDACFSNDLEELKKCEKMLDEMTRYKPGGQEARKLETKYKEHPYFQPKEKSSFKDQS